jgi:glycosyltransferase involved in cell wall biosynthesis
VRILTNFMHSPPFIELARDERIEVICRDAWPEVRKRLKSADVIVIDCRDLLLYRICIHFLLFPWTRKPLVAVDLVLRIPVHLKQRIGGLIKRLLLSRVAHFIHYFRDISGYTRHFGISAGRSSYVPFKVNIQDIRLSPAEISEDYIFTMGRSLRDYDSFIRAVAELPYPAAIPEFSFNDFEGKDETFAWTRENVPAHLTILADSGSSEDLVRNIAKARLVVIPTQACSICASGLSTYLDAMYLGKCVILSSGPGASDVLTDQALLVAPHDVAALKDAIRRAWEDDLLRKRTAESGRNYALSLGGEKEFLQRIFRQVLDVVAMPPSGEIV